MQIFTWILRYDVILKFCYFRGVGVGGTVAAPEFGRSSVNPIQTREQITSPPSPDYKTFIQPFTCMYIHFILKILLRYK